MCIRQSIFYVCMVACGLAVVILNCVYAHWVQATKSCSSAALKYALAYEDDLKHWQYYGLGLLFKFLNPKKDPRCLVAECQVPILGAVNRLSFVEATFQWLNSNGLGVFQLWLCINLVILYIPALIDVIQTWMTGRDYSSKVNQKIVSRQKDVMENRRELLSLVMHEEHNALREEVMKLREELFKAKQVRNRHLEVRLPHINRQDLEKVSLYCVNKYWIRVQTNLALKYFQTGQLYNMLQAVNAAENLELSNGGDIGSLKKFDYLKALLHTVVRQDNTALEHFTKVLEGGEELLDARFIRAFILLRIGRLREAERDFLCLSEKDNISGRLAQLVNQMIELVGSDICPYVAAGLSRKATARKINKTYDEMCVRKFRGVTTEHKCAIWFLLHNYEKELYDKLSRKVQKHRPKISPKKLLKELWR